MKIFDTLRNVPEKIYVMVFFGIFLVTGLSAYFTMEDTALLEKRIEMKQKDLAEVIQLRDVYETKKHEPDRYSPAKADNQGISLGLVEEMVTKSFVGGRLTSLQPSTGNDEKKGKRAAVEIKVAGAALGEIVAFTEATEKAGLRIEKLNLSLPASNPMALDMQATVTEGRSRE